MPKFRIVVFIAALVTVVATVTIMTRSDSGQTRQSKPTDPPRLGGRVFKDRTTPALRGMSATQREHARILNRDFKSHSKLLDEQASVTSNPIRFSDGNPEPMKTPEELVTDFACSSDAVFSGRVFSSQSFPVEDGTWLFTESQVRVDTVFKQRAVGSTIRRGEIVRVVRPGGSMDASGRLVTAGQNDYPPLHLDRDYVFFADRIPKTGAFKVVRPVFVLADSSLSNVTPVEEVREDRSLDHVPLAALLAALRSATCR